MTEDLVPVPKHVKIQEGWAGLSVLEAVRRAFPEVTPREVFRKARGGEILVAARPCRPLDRVSAGEILTVILRRPESHPPSLPLRQDEEVSTPAGPFRVVREDEDLLVVSKPAGCASHPAARQRGDTLIERVRWFLGVSPEHDFQPALANRLDIGTSGLVLVGKTKRAQNRLGQHLQRGSITKDYLALVGGWPAAAGEIREPLARHPDSRDLAKFHVSGRPLPQVKIQEAVTRYRVLERLGPPVACAWVEVELLTGRTHQIRRHFTHHGNPLAGDTRYGDPEFNRVVRSVGGLTRLFLHAYRVRLKHPVTGEDLELLAPLPAELAACLKALGASQRQGFEGVWGAAG